MEWATLKLVLTEWISGSWGKIAVTVGIVALYFFIDRFTAPRLRESADRGDFKQLAARKAIRTVRVISALVSVFLLIVVWGIDLTALLISATTVITLLGVALFANWSILSNITSYFVLLLHPSYSRGTFIRVIESDNYVEGYISDLLLFNIELKMEDGQKILYPNNLLLGRVVIADVTKRLNGIGKISSDTPVDKKDSDASTLSS